MQLSAEVSEGWESRRSLLLSSASAHIQGCPQFLVQWHGQCVRREIFVCRCHIIPWSTKLGFPHPATYFVCRLLCVNDDKETVKHIPVLPQKTKQQQKTNNKAKQHSVRKSFTWCIHAPELIPSAQWQAPHVPASCCPELLANQCAPGKSETKPKLGQSSFCFTAHGRLPSLQGTTQLQEYTKWENRPLLITWWFQARTRITENWLNLEPSIFTYSFEESRNSRHLWK